MDNYVDNQPYQPSSQAEPEAITNEHQNVPTPTSESATSSATVTANAENPADTNIIKLSEALKDSELHLLERHHQRIKEIFFQASYQVQTGKLKASNPRPITLNEIAKKAGLPPLKRGGEEKLLDFDLEDTEWIKQYYRYQPRVNATAYTETSVVVGYALFELEQARNRGDEQDMKNAINRFLKVYDETKADLKLPARHDKEEFSAKNVNIKKRKTNESGKTSYVNISDEEKEQVLKEVKEKVSNIL